MNKLNVWTPCERECNEITIEQILGNIIKIFPSTTEDEDTFSRFGWNFAIESFCPQIRLVERKHVRYRAAQFMFGFDLSRKERGCGVVRLSIVGFDDIDGWNLRHEWPSPLPRMTDNRTLNWIFFRNEESWPYPR